MDIAIDAATTTDDLTDFLSFQDRINSNNETWWPAIVPMNLPMLQGEGPSAPGRRFLPLVARRNGDIIARVLAVVDQRYLDHWNEPLGHISMFEALPDTVDEVRVLHDEACAWLREHGMEAARAGFGVGDFPFRLDAYDVLPPAILRQNPPYYHTLLKEAGYQSERGWVDYKMPVTEELSARWHGFVEDAERRGYEMRRLRDIPAERRLSDFIETWNESFTAHWGIVPQVPAEFGDLLTFLEPMGMLDASVIAYRDDTPVGAVWVVPESASSFASTNTRDLMDAEKMNTLAIGVRPSARRQGVNLAMAAAGYLELAKRGQKYVSYTLVLDDNWPSRRTAEKLGASICANYMVYRRDFDRR